MALVSGFAAGDFIVLEGQLATSVVRRTQAWVNSHDNRQFLVQPRISTWLASDQQSQFSIANGEVEWSVSATPPSITAPGTATVGAGQPCPISGISVSETPTTTGETFTVVLTDTNGVLSASTATTGGGGTITPSNGGATLTISGTLAQLNADLTTLTDNDAMAGSDTITVNATDSPWQRGGADDHGAGSMVNGAPRITALTLATVGVDEAALITGGSLTESGGHHGRDRPL